MKRILYLFLIISIVLALSACGDSEKSKKVFSDGDWQYTLTDNEATITKYRNITLDVEIPDKFGDYPVVAVSSETFNDSKDRISKVALPEGIQSLESSVFKNCVNLKSINIPKNIKAIGSSAFEGCIQLEIIKIEAKSIDIGPDAFKDTKWYEKQKNGIIYIGDIAYEYKGSATKENISIKNGTRVVQLYGISASNIKSVIIPASVTKIASRAFSGCNFLSNIIIEDGLIDLFIGEDTFSGTGLTAISLPTRLKNIGKSAFKGCVSLKKVTIPAGKNEISIGQSAFQGCTSLKEITIPAGKNEISIGQSAFADCESLKQIIFEPGESNVIIGPSVFQRTGIETLNLPARVKQIGESAFSECLLLKKVVVNAGIITIPISAFSGCTSLEVVTLNDGVIYIEKYAFFECIKLQKVYLPASIKRIDTSAFWYKTWRESDFLHIVGEKGSYAEIFSMNHAIIFDEN